MNVSKAAIAKKILIVEDSAVQAQVLKALLEKYNVRVLWAEDGEVGVRLAADWLPDVVILDVRMPKLDGIEVFRQLRDNPKTDHIPVVIMTCYNEPAVFKMGIYLGAVNFIPKDGFANAVLLRTLNQLEIVPENSLAQTDKGQ